MVAPWLGSLRQLMVDLHSPIDGPDPLNSAAYVADYNQVKRIGRANAPLSDRSAAETATALFFNANSATMVGDALIRRLEARGMDLLSTAWTFAAMHASMTDSAIQCWRLKRDLGYLRPHEAITGSVDDGNPATVVEAGWTPLVTPVPNYADYVSGHACLTSPQIGVIREVLGQDTALELRSINGPPRVYTEQLAHIEHDAYYARIWSGLHFADAMDDGYLIGHDTAARVMAALASRLSSAGSATTSTRAPLRSTVISTRVPIASANRRRWRDWASPSGTVSSARTMSPRRRPLSAAGLPSTTSTTRSAVRCPVRSAQAAGSGAGLLTRPR